MTIQLTRSVVQSEIGAEFLAGMELSDAVSACWVARAHSPGTAPAASTSAIPGSTTTWMTEWRTIPVMGANLSLSVSRFTFQS
jgi:hypothetical protein